MHGDHATQNGFCNAEHFLDKLVKGGSVTNLASAPAACFAARDILLLVHSLLMLAI